MNGRKNHILAVLLMLLGVFSSHAQTASFLSKYEYWIDDDYEHKQTGEHTSSTLELEIDCSSYATGVHVFNFRGLNSEDQYGPLSQSLFFVAHPEEPESRDIAGYEYWIDTPANRTFVESSAAEIPLEISMDDLKVGVHQFFFRSKATNGRWGALHQMLFARPAPAETRGETIVGYSYNFGGESKYVKITPRTNYTLGTSIALPDLKKIGSIGQGCSFSFGSAQATMNRTQNVVFNIQFKNDKEQWSNPTCYGFTMTDAVSHAYVPLAIGRRAVLEQAEQGDYQAVKCVVNEPDYYYIKTTVPCNIDVYKSTGVLLESILPEDLEYPHVIDLSAGTYYCVAYNMSDATTLRLLQYEECVEEPVITFEDKQVTITCTDPDADIYYTLDGSEPTESSAKYTAPFILGRNCTIQAVAMCEGASPSDVVSLVVDSHYADNFVMTYNGTDEPVLSDLSNSSVSALSLTDNSLAFVEGDIQTSGLSKPENVIVKDGANWVASDVALTDAEPYYSPTDVQTDELSYARTFPHTNWQALYVPFEADYSAWKSQGVQVAEFSNVHQYEDGKTVIEFFTLKDNSVVKANVPYLIKPNSVGSVSFDFANVILTETPAEAVSVMCQSTRSVFSLTGIYQPKSGLSTVNDYVMKDGTFLNPTTESVVLNPFRIFLSVSEHDYGTRAMSAPHSIILSVDGKELGTTDIDLLIEDSETGVFYDLNGNVVKKPTRGIFIDRGKKVMNK